MKFSVEWGKLFPPGYEYEKEKGVAELLLGGGVLLSLRFFGRLRDAAAALYYIDRVKGKTLRPDAVAESFAELAAGAAAGFLPLYLFAIAMAVYHYLGYYRDTKSIYLMKRLPKRGSLIKSCVQAPLAEAAAGAVCTVVLGLIYYGIYLLIIPPECMPRFLCITVRLIP